MTRRKWLAGAGALLSSGCGARRTGGYAGSALVATAGEHSVTVIDLARFQPVKQVAVGAAPALVAAGGPGGTSYVLTPGSGSLHALDANFVRLRSQRVASGLAALRLSPDGRRLFTLSPPQRELIQLDARTLAVERRVKLDEVPAWLDVASDGSIAISSGPAGVITCIDGKSGRMACRRLAGDLGAALFRSDGKLLLVARFREQALSALSVPDLQVIGDLPVAMQPRNLCFKPDGGQLFVTGPGMDGVAIAFPYLPLDIDQTVLAGRDPGVMACANDPAYLFIASASGSEVAILSVENRKMIGVVEVGQDPRFVTVTPDDEYALVLNRGSGDMAVIDLASVSANVSNPVKLRSKACAALFTMLPVGSQPVHAVVVPLV